MRINSLLSLVAGIALLSSASMALAQDDKKSDKGSPEERHAALFDKLDANHDGYITADEAPPEHQKLFNRLLRIADKDHDGKLSRDEFLAGLDEDHPIRAAEKSGDKSAADQSGPPGGPNRMGPPGGAFGFGGPDGRPGERMMMGAIVFRALDTNGDGKLDEKEIAAAGESLKKLAKNGEITRDDLTDQMRGMMGGAAAGAGAPGGGALAGLAQLSPEEAAKRFVKRFDKNGDGKVQKDELPPRLQDRFDELDTNHDGALDESELKPGLPELIRRYAAQRDGAKGNAEKRDSSAGDKKSDESNK